MPEAIKRIGVQFMKEPEHVKIAAKELTTDLVDQYYIRVKAVSYTHLKYKMVEETVVSRSE